MSPCVCGKLVAFFRFDDIFLLAFIEFVEAPQQLVIETSLDQGDK